ncbi:MAG TPA: PQQ-binding-like beta-propeller repeat protein [Ktedonosporobacter sp.]|nr:PQQ-binding-like beta-propeller repeat protein [Ktedonosporobacter sp.]
MRKAMQSGPTDDFAGKTSAVDALEDDFEVEIRDLRDGDVFEESSSPRVKGPLAGLPQRAGLTRASQGASARYSKVSQTLLHRVGLTSKVRRRLAGLLVVATALLIVVVIFPTLIRFLAPNRSFQAPVADPAFSSSFQPFSIGAVTAGVTYAIGPNQTLHALNTIDGTQLWQSKFPFYTANPQNTYVYIDHDFAYQVLQQNQVQMASESKAAVLRLSDGRPLTRGDGLPPGSWPVLIDHGNVASSSFFWVGNSISAINASDGSLLWQYHLNANQGFSGIPLRDKLLVSVSPTAGKSAPLSMLRVSDGSEIWHYADSRFSLLYAPANLFNGLLYLSDSEGAVRALRVSDGSIAWQYTPRIPGLFTVAINDGKIYVDTELGGIDALDATDGSLLWHWKQTLAMHMVQEMDGVVYATTTDGVVYAIRAQDGVQLWHFSTRSSGPDANAVAPDVSVVTAQDGIVYLDGQAPSQPGSESTLYALRTSDSALLWKRVIGASFSSDGGFFFGGGFLFNFASPLQVIHHTLYLNVTTDKPGAIRASDGYVLWLAPHPASGLQVVDEIAYSTSSQGVLNAYRARDGALLWQYPK